MPVLYPTLDKFAEEVYEASGDRVTKVIIEAKYTIEAQEGDETPTVIQPAAVMSIDTLDEQGTYPTRQADVALLHIDRDTRVYRVDVDVSKPYFVVEPIIAVRDRKRGR